MDCTPATLERLSKERRIARAALRDLIAAAEPVLQEQADIAMGEYATKIDNVLATIAAAKKVLGGEND